MISVFEKKNIPHRNAYQRTNWKYPKNHGLLQLHIAIPRFPYIFVFSRLTYSNTHITKYEAIMNE